MTSEIRIGEPKLKQFISMRTMRSDHLVFIDMADAEETEELFQITQAAKDIAPVVFSLPENQGKNGFVLAVTRASKNYPNFTVQVGNVTEPDTSYLLDGKLGKYVEFATLKAQVLKFHPEFMSSSQNLSLPEYMKVRSRVGQEIPAGAIRFMDDKIISISAFKNPNIDTATGLAIVIKAKLITQEQARQMASDPSVNCLIELESIISAAELLGLNI
jgi:hypothetical protein